MERPAANAAGELQTVRRLPAILAVALLVGCQTVAPVPGGLANLAQVDAGRNVWRSAQFDASGLAGLKSRGIMRVLKLNTRSESNLDDLATAAGLEVRYSPLTTRQQLGLDPIPTMTVLEDLAFAARGNCLIHCEHGQDRTGMVCACYRMLIQGWTYRAARAEMDAMGFHPLLRGLGEFTETFKP